MDLFSLLGAAFLLGLTGGIHCLAMCTGLQHSLMGWGSISGGSPRPAAIDPDTSADAHPLRFVPPRPGPSSAKGPSLFAATDAVSQGPATGRAGSPRTSLGVLLQFHAARICGYALLGAAVAALSATLRWSAEWASSLRTLWILLNAAVLSLGLALALRGAMPAWIDGWTHRLWKGVQAGWLSGRRPPVMALGLAWALLPCGLLAGALALALLASDAIRGAAVMASFGLGTAVDLMMAQFALNTLHARLQRAGEGWQRAGIRLAGLMLAVMAGIALWAIARGQPHPFCGSP